MTFHKENNAATANLGEKYKFERISRFIFCQNQNIRIILRTLILRAEFCAMWQIKIYFKSSVYSYLFYRSQKNGTSLYAHQFIMKIWYIYTMEYNWAFKKNRVMNFVSKWLELDTIILSKEIQTQTVKHHAFPHVLILSLKFTFKL